MNHVKGRAISTKRGRLSSGSTKHHDILKDRFCSSINLPRPEKSK